MLVDILENIKPFFIAVFGDEYGMFGFGLVSGFCFGVVLTWVFLRRFGKTEFKKTTCIGKKPDGDTFKSIVEVGSRYGKTTFVNCPYLLERKTCLRSKKPCQYLK